MYQNYLKRVFDFCCALLALIILSPLLLIFMILGAVFMGGNPFFTQPRPGKDEKIFKLVKFRTMNNRKDENGNLLPDEIRLNGYGKFLRTTSVDELPELINILKGDMAVIGPRPQLVRDMVFMTEEQRKRHMVRPGLSGLAQVNGRNVITWEDVFKSVEEVTELASSLEKKGYLKDGNVTEMAMEEIEPLKVDNAVILAAGGSDISAKSVYNMPKGLFMKNGETLIERQIRQLKEAGINDITVVIGYKQELYFFLVDKWGVNIEINPDLKKNNIYSLYIAKNFLGSTYILNCDNYFEENPFSQYEYNSFHATVYKEDASNELVVMKNQSGRILDVFSCAKSGECIYGHAYMDRELSRRLLDYMEEEINDFRVSALFWEEFINRHIDDLDMYVREYSPDFLFEFDSIQEIQNIDGLFLGNVSGWINEKICSVLDCTEDEIGDINVLQKGLSNILFTFVVRGERYIFRYPGDSTQFFIYRKNECVANQLAAKAHADDTFIYIDEQGAKISKFRENCIDLHGKYYEDVEIMKRVVQKIRAFHEIGYDLTDWEEYNYDPIWQAERLFKEAAKMKGDLFKIFEKEWVMLRKLQKYADMDGFKHTMCHNDINIDNILMTDDTLDIIDYEFAGYNDPGYDFGRVIAGLEYEADEPKIKEILEAYFGRPATEKEHLHWMAYSAIHNWYYVGWALYKESINESSRDWMVFFFKQAKKLASWCLPQYEALYGQIEDPKAAPEDWRK